MVPENKNNYSEYTNNKESKKGISQEKSILNQSGPQPIDVEEQFRQKLLKKKIRNAHLQFFIQPTTNKLNFPIVTQVHKNKQIIPFRNKKCLLPSCIYDLEELINRYTNNMYSSYIHFNCKICNREISMDDFELDKTLQEIINNVWEEFNKKDNVICKSVTIYRDGNWKPNIPQYFDKLFTSLASNLGDPTIKRKIPSIIEQGGILINQKITPHLIPLSDFTQSEFQTLENIFNEESCKNSDLMLKNNDVPLRVIDYLNFREGHSTSDHLLAFFLNYLECYQKQNPKKFNKNLKNRWKFMVFKINKFDHITYESRISYVGCFHNCFKSNPKEIYNLYDRFACAISIDGRWIIIIVNLRSHEFYQVDFLSGEMSSLNEATLLKIICNIVKNEFSLAMRLKVAIQVPKIEFFDDCALDVMNFLNKATTMNSPEEVVVKYGEKKNLVKQVCWLILQSKYSKSTEIDYFVPEKKNDELASPVGGSLPLSQKFSLSPIAKKKNLPYLNVSPPSEDPLLIQQNLHNKSNVSRKSINQSIELSPIHNSKNLLSPSIVHQSNLKENYAQNQKEIENSHEKFSHQKKLHESTKPSLKLNQYLSFSLNDSKILPPNNVNDSILRKSRLDISILPPVTSTKKAGSQKKNKINLFSPFLSSGNYGSENPPKNPSSINKKNVLSHSHHNLVQNQVKSPEHSDNEISMNRSSLHNFFQDIKKMKEELLTEIKENKHSLPKFDLKKKSVNNINNDNSSDILKHLDCSLSNQSFNSEQSATKPFTNLPSKRTNQKNNVSVASNKSIHLTKDELKDLIDKHTEKVVEKMRLNMINEKPKEEDEESEDISYVDQFGNPFPPKMKKKKKKKFILPNGMPANPAMKQLMMNANRRGQVFNRGMLMPNNNDQDSENTGSSNENEDQEDKENDEDKNDDDDEEENDDNEEDDDDDEDEDDNEDDDEDDDDDDDDEK